MDRYDTLWLFKDTKMTTFYVRFYCSKIFQSQHLNVQFHNDSFYVEIQNCLYYLSNIYLIRNKNVFME